MSSPQPLGPHNRNTHTTRNEMITPLRGKENSPKKAKSPPRRYQSKWESDFNFEIKEGSDPFHFICIPCNKELKLENEGKKAITKHRKKPCHTGKLSQIEGTTVEKIIQLNMQKDSGPDPMKLLEATFVYGAITHGLSFRCMDWFSEFMQVAFSVVKQQQSSVSNFACKRSKSELISKATFAPFAKERMLEEMKAAQCVTFHFDTSNRGEVKLFPFATRHFEPLVGVKVRFLHLVDVTGEDHKTLLDAIKICISDVSKQIGTNFEEKVTTICADSTNTNFGGHDVNLEGDNIYAKLVVEYGRFMFPMHCPAHYLNNCIRNACNKVQVLNVQKLLYNIHKEFRGKTVRVTTLKAIIARLKTSTVLKDGYKPVLGCSVTRWLSILPSADRFDYLQPAMCEYYVNRKPTKKESGVRFVKSFLTHKQGMAMLTFVKEHAKRFHSTILKVEGKFIQVLSVITNIRTLLEEIALLRDTVFLGIEVTKYFGDDWTDDDVSEFKVRAKKFYSETYVYLKKWSDPLMELDVFMWAQLSDPIDNSVVDDILASMGYMKDKFNTDFVDIGLMNEFVHFKAYVNKSIVRWDKNKVKTLSRWIEMFRYFDRNSIKTPVLYTLTCFIFSVAASNAEVERIFSFIRKYFSFDKSNVNVPTICAYLHNKINLSSYLKSDNEGEPISDSPKRVFDFFNSEPKLQKRLKTKYQVGEFS